MTRNDVRAYNRWTTNSEDGAAAAVCEAEDCFDENDRDDDEEDTVATMEDGELPACGMSMMERKPVGGKILFRKRSLNVQMNYFIFFVAL